MSKKYKITSGEFQVIVHEKTLVAAGNLAIRLHGDSNHPSLLGDLILIEQLDKNSRRTGRGMISKTEQLINFTEIS
jgi:hypothetical protein